MLASSSYSNNYHTSSDIKSSARMYSISNTVIALCKGIDHHRLSLQFSSRISCAVYFSKPPLLQQNASGRKYILSVTYATNFIENTSLQYTFKW